MRLFVALSAVSLAVAAPATATTMSPMHKSHAMMKSHMSGSASTTPAMNRPGDADLRSANKKGGTGGKNSSSNGS